MQGALFLIVAHEDFFKDAKRIYCLTQKDIEAIKLLTKTFHAHRCMSEKNTQCMYLCVRRIHARRACIYV